MGSGRTAGRSRGAASTIRFTAALRAEYERLFASCEIRTEWLGRVDRAVGRIQANRARYEIVGNALGVPWALIGAIHNLESSLNFKKHLHNGDPLTARTVREPAGRPAAGEPPFLWAHSAIDALTLHGLDRWRDWAIAGTLFQLERFNGWGYRLHHPEVLSPYLWSGSQHYAAGKYADDHTFSPTAVSQQVGGAVVLRRMAERGEAPPAEATSGPEDRDAVPLIAFTPRTARPDVAGLQRFLNTLPGIHLLVDGKAGPRTSGAARRAFGHYLSGDPRNDSSAAPRSGTASKEETETNP